VRLSPKARSGIEPDHSKDSSRTNSTGFLAGFELYKVLGRFELYRVPGRFELYRVLAE
jgi:hypothetical protein